MPYFAFIPEDVYTFLSSKYIKAVGGFHPISYTIDWTNPAEVAWFFTSSPFAIMMYIIIILLVMIFIFEVFKYWKCCKPNP